MSQQTINTVIVLRNDKTTAWEKSEYVLLEGEVGIGYLENGNVIAKLGDGEHTWADLPQIEGVFEDELTLTYNFGRYKTSNGSVTTTDAKGKTVSEWLIHALSEVLNPKTNYPSVSLTAGAYIEGATSTATKCEIGEKITALRWDGTFSAGSYKDNANSGTYGTTASATSNSTGLTASNVDWLISNSVDSQTASTEDGKFTLVSDKYIQVNSESATTYATISAVATLDASGARTPLNNIGKPYEAGKITGFKVNNVITDTDTPSAGCSVTGYRKPFYGVLTPDKVLNIDTLTSAEIRALPKSGTDTAGLPSSIDVPAGSQMVIFAAKAGTYSSLTATDDLGQNATVSFEKEAGAVDVKGANGFTAASYDVWYVKWPAGIDAAKKLTLKWS